MNIPLSNVLSAHLAPRHFVARERLPKHCNQRTVARKEHGMRDLLGPPALRSDVEPNKGLACTWNSSDKQDRLEPVTSRRLDDRFQCLRRDR